MNTGKCPKCDKVMTSVEVEDMDVTVNFRSAWRGASFVCPSCRAILSVGIDPIALKSDIVNQILEKLRR